MRFLLPEGGVSLIDAPGQPFFDPEADAALFATIESRVDQTARPPGRAGGRQHQRSRFAAAALAAFDEVTP